MVTLEELQYSTAQVESNQNNLVRYFDNLKIEACRNRRKVGTPADLNQTRHKVNQVISSRVFGMEILPERQISDKWMDGEHNIHNKS